MTQCAPMGEAWKTECATTVNANAATIQPLVNATALEGAVAGYMASAPSAAQETAVKTKLTELLAALKAGTATAALYDATEKVQGQSAPVLVMYGFGTVMVAGFAALGLK